MTRRRGSCAAIHAARDASPVPLGTRALFAPLLACAWVLGMAWPAAAQTPPAPPPQAPPSEAPPAEAPPSEAPPSDAPPSDAPPSQAPPSDAPASDAPPTDEVAPGAADASTPPAAAPIVPDPEPTAEAAPEEAEAGPPMESREEIVVTGYRRSLEAALSRKQRSTTQVDAIVAEDMADFPDLNLAESLQRVPGVAITRDSGEGARLTVRGLSGRFTRTRINGMDTRVSLGDTVNAPNREFDFNLFASELFNSIVIHKTATAELGEGSLGAVIDLNTARPFSYKEGFTFLVGGQGTFNDLSMTVRPRAAGLINYRDPGGVWGATASVAYSLTRNDEDVSDTVRWQKARFGTVNGVACAPTTTPLADEPDANCAAVRDSFHPRIPRYLERITSSERLGLTAGVQVKPSDKTDIRLDGLYALYNQDREDRTLEVLFRQNEGSMSVSNFTLGTFPARLGATNNTITSADVDNAWVRSESVLRLSENDFYQLTLAVDHEFTDAFYLKAMAGRSRAEGHIPHFTTLMYDNRAYNGFRYDYRDSMSLPTLAYEGVDVTSASNFFLTELRDVVHTTVNTFDTGELKLYYEIIDPLRLSTGFTIKRMDHDTKQQNRDGTICGLMLYDCDADDDGTNELIGRPGEAGLTDITEYDGPTGAGSTTRWASPSIDGWTDELGYYDVPLRDDTGRIRHVEETTLGTYLQADGEIPIQGDMRLLYNAGVQYVQTRQTSGGYQGAEFLEFERPVYHDVLPSANTALWFNDAVVVRLAAAQVLARPALNDLTPGGAVDGFNRVINYRNPELDPTRALVFDAAAEWYFAKESLLGLALFMKDIESFPYTAERFATYASTGLPTNLIPSTLPLAADPDGDCDNPEGCWEINELQNGPGATVKGLELAFQAPLSSLFENLPPVVRGLGVIANFTLVDSNTTYQWNDDIDVEERLLQLSNRSLNATLYYEDSKFGARISAAHRSSYLVSGPNVNGNQWEFVESSTRFDFSSSYNVIDEFEITLEALNLTDEPVYSKVDVDANRLLEYRKTGRNFLLGMRYTH